jgi:hypothetical protein
MQQVDFSKFKPATKIKNDSDEEFKEYLRNYIHMWILSMPKNLNLTKIRYYTVPSTIGATSNSIPVPLYDIDEESLRYLNPELYNELGLKYFSNHSASNMYKYFKNLVDQ